jgi:nucleoside-diphosphate-sugar epimerase
MKTALVTGSAGFVGRHMARRLEAGGWRVVGLDIRTDPAQDVRRFFREDASAPGTWDLVVHCAAVVGGRRTIEGNPLALAVDLSIDAELFGWALRTRPGRVVYFSSSAAYPVEYQSRDIRMRLPEHLIDLAHVRTPDLVYGWAKLTGEMLAAHARAAGIPVTVLRPFSGYGADQDLAYPFPSFIDRAARRADPFEIWGDGLQVRDWIHIDDVVGATMACIVQGVDGPLNLGHGRPTSFLELAGMVTSGAGYRPALALHRERPAGVAYRVADPTRMLEVYRPAIPLELGIAEALVAARAAA